MAEPSLQEQLASTEAEIAALEQLKGEKVPVNLPKDDAIEELDLVNREIQALEELRAGVSSQDASIEPPPPTSPGDILKAAIEPSESLPEGVADDVAGAIGEIAIAGAGGALGGALGKGAVAAVPKVAQRVAGAVLPTVGETAGEVAAGQLAGLNFSTTDLATIAGVNSTLRSLGHAGRGVKKLALAAKNSEKLGAAIQKTTDTALTLKRRVVAAAPKFIGAAGDDLTERPLLSGLFGIPSKKAALKNIPINSEIGGTLEAVDNLDAFGMFTKRNVREASKLSKKAFKAGGSLDEAAQRELREEIKNFQWEGSANPEDYLGGRQVVSVSPSDIEHAALVRRQQIFGEDFITGEFVPEDKVVVKGILGDLTEEIAKNPNSKISVSEVRELLEGTISESNKSAARLVDKEVDAIYKKALGSEQFKNFEARRKVFVSVDSKFRKAVGKGVETASPDELIEVLGKKKALEFKGARRDYENLLRQAESSSVNFPDLIKKRISMDSFAKYNIDSKNTPAESVQAFRAMSSALRGKIDDIAGQRVGGNLGENYLAVKKHASDLLEVMPHIHKSGASQRAGFVGAPGGVAFGVGAIIRAAIAKETRSSPFAAMRLNIARMLEQGGTVQGKFEAISQLDELTMLGLPIGKAGRVVGDVGAGTTKLVSSTANKAIRVFNRSTGSVTGSVDDINKFFKALTTEEGVSGPLAAWAVGSLFIESATNTFMLAALEGNGFTDFTPEGLEKARQDPEVQATLEQAKLQAQEMATPLLQAIEKGNTFDTAVALAQYKKAHPDPGVFPETKSGLVGEVQVGGKSFLPLPEDRQVYASILRSKDFKDEDLWKAFNSLNKNGEVSFKVNF